jgi:hypothetical protein
MDSRECLEIKWKSYSKKTLDITGLTLEITGLNLEITGIKEEKLG